MANQSNISNTTTLPTLHERNISNTTTLLTPHESNLSNTTTLLTPQLFQNISSTSTQTINPINFSDVTWILVATCLVLLMIPGLGIFYSGLVQTKNQLSLLFSTVISLVIVSIQWYLFGYSLVFSSTGSPIIGNFENSLLINVGNNPNGLAPTIPSNLLMIYQCMFASITPCIAFGAVAERARLIPYLLFLMFWSTFVYDFTAYWTWGINGWLRTLGTLDFAGGAPVHISSGFGALAYAIAVGPRKKVDFKSEKPSNLTYVFSGTALLWFGWMGFNGGSGLAINSRSVNAVVVTNMAACVGGLTWVLIEMIFNKTKTMSLNGFCTGVIVGLVAITPASGFVSQSSSLAFGFIGSIVCFFATKIKILIKYRIDDALDVFAIHGVGGAIGNILTGIFAQNSIVTMAGDASISGGFIDGNYIQIVYQFVAVIACGLWSLVITLAILKLIDFLPFLKLRLDESEEEQGVDWIEMGEYSDSKLYDLNSKQNLDNSKRISSKFHKDTIEPFEMRENVIKRDFINNASNENETQINDL